MFDYKWIAIAIETGIHYPLLHGKSHQARPRYRNR